jgi:hypothetical protein
MAREATLFFETGIAIPFTASAAIEKGALCSLAEGMACVTHDGTGDVQFAGVAAKEITTAEVTAGNVTIPLYRQGIFKMTANAAIAVGAAVAFDAVANTVKTAVAADVSTDIIGFALEGCNAQDDTILVEVRPGANNNAYS